MKGITGLLTGLLFSACTGGPEPHDPPPVPAQAQCPIGFGPIGTLGDGCYQLQPTATSWVEGEAACEKFESEGAKAHMVVIDREEEHLAFSALSKSGDIWLARMQHDEDDEFRNINWIIYEPEHWNVGEPNDYGEDCNSLFDCEGRPGIGDERCVEYRGVTGLWNDKGCWRESRIICEWDSLEPYGWRPGGST